METLGWVDLQLLLKSGGHELWAEWGASLYIHTPFLYTIRSLQGPLPPAYPDHALRPAQSSSITRGRGASSTKRTSMTTRCYAGAACAACTAAPTISKCHEVLPPAGPPPHTTQG